MCPCPLAVTQPAPQTLNHTQHTKQHETKQLPTRNSYVPWLASIFSIVPLSLAEWGLVLAFALPVILIDEILKLLGRRFFGVRRTRRGEEAKAAAAAAAAAAGGSGPRRLKAE